MSRKTKVPEKEEVYNKIDLLLAKTGVFLSSNRGFLVALRYEANLIFCRSD